MKIFHLKEHFFNCPCCINHEQREVIDTDNFFVKLAYKNKYMCEKNPKRFFFQLNSEFFMIVYYECITHGDVSGYFVDLIKRSLSESKNKKLANVKKSIPLKDLLKEMKRGDFSFKNYHEEIVHIYDGSFKVPEYCITRKTEYFNTIFSNDIFKQNYLKAIEYLKINDLYEDHGEELYRLYKLNLIPNHYYISQSEIIQSTNQLITQINKIANGND